MAKRKRGGAQAQSQQRRASFDENQKVKLNINSYQDVAGSDDEFHLNREKILLDDGPDAKRRRRLEEQADIIEASDEEVLAYSSESENEDDVADDDDEDDAASGSEGTGEGNEEEEEEEGWGPSRSDYYNADVIETEQDALDEETEARRIQQKRLKALQEADFGFDEEAWQQKEQDEGQAQDGFMEDGVVTEVLPQLQVSDSMSASERLKMLKKRYPEFEHLVTELLELQPLHRELVKSTTAHTHHAGDVVSDSSSDEEESIERIRLQALSAYLGSLAMYLVLLTSAAQADPSKSFPMAPHELREHEVMQSLVQSREMWARVQELDAEGSMSSGEVDAEELEYAESDIGISDAEALEDEVIPVKKTSKKSKTDAPASSDPSAQSLARRAARAKATEDRLSALSALTSINPSKPRIVITTSTSTSKSKKPANSADIDIDSDIGDEPTLAPHEAEEKARRKKSLRFYTSQIAQKANKRATAGRAAGGDDDLPYRERFRDRQERLNAEAAARGRKVDGGKGAELGGEDSEGESVDGGDDETRVTNRERGGDDDDEYAAQLEARVRAKKAGKVDREAAYRQAKEEGGKVVVYAEKGVGPDGRREVGYQIEKNKGLTPHRKKDVRNPRLKKRLKYEDKKKKLASMKPTFKGGEGRGGYKGELTGIKTNLVRSTKF